MRRRLSTLAPVEGRPVTSLAALGLALVVLAGLVGCEGCGATGGEPTGTSEAPDGPRGASAAGVAVIEGTLRLPEGAEPAQYPEHPMIPGPGRPPLPEGCTPPQQIDRVPVRLGDGGGLSGALVAIADFAREIPHEPVTHRLDIVDCRLTPRLVAATRGDTLVLHNSTDYPYMPDLGTGMLRGVLHDQERELELGQGGVRTLTCGFAASCGRAEVVTLYHPLHAVTDQAGHYRIEGVPAGEELRVNAWHPLYQETNETITLRAGETRTLDFVLTPAGLPVQPDTSTDTSANTFEGHPEDNPETPIF